MTWRSVVVVLALSAGATVQAQWVHYPTKGVPRTADGTPNLAAPAPRTPDGKPDLSGIWQLDPGDTCSRPGGCQVDYPPGPEFINLGSKLQGGLPYQPWAAALVKQRSEQLGKDDPVGYCKPGGAVRILTYPPYRKIVQLPDLVIILSERDVTYRQIFTDGRPLPDDPTPTFNGYSVGRWDRDTFVVETNGLREGTWLDRNGSPISDVARMTERFHRANYGRLEIDLTIDDAKAYTKPWTVTLVQRIVLDTELMDYHCNDNEKSAGHMVGR